MCSVCCVSTTLLIYRPLRDGWLSWPCWLTDSGRLNRKVVTHPASSLAQDRESSPAETSVLTTTLCCQPTFDFSKVDCKAPFVINPVSSAVPKQSKLKLYLNTKLPRCKTVALHTRSKATYKQQALRHEVDRTLTSCGIARLQN